MGINIGWRGGHHVERTEFEFRGIAVPDGFTAVGNVAHIDGLQATFSSHLAAFEACMRIRKPLWRPHGRDTHFANEADMQAFTLLNAQHAERA